MQGHLLGKAPQPLRNNAAYGLYKAMPIGLRVSLLPTTPRNTQLIDEFFESLHFHRLDSKDDRTPDQRMKFSTMKSYSAFEPCTPIQGGRERPQSIVLPDDPVSCSFDKLSLGTDSGYGSASSSPEDSQQPFDEQRSQTPSKAVDNEISKQPTPIRSRSLELSIRSGTYPRKTVKIKIFDKGISESVQNRFKDLNELFGKPLYDYLSKKQPLTSIVSIKLKVLGTNQDDAKPWIVVMCDKSVSKKVKQFFNQSHIKSEYQPPDADQTSPFFEIVVCERPPRRLAANPRLNVYSDFQPDGDDCGVLSGRIVRFGEPDKGRIATLGGVVMIRSPKNEVRLYGMTAGHVVTQDLISDIGATASKSSCDTDEEEENHDDSPIYSLEDSGDFELGSAYEDDEYVVSTNAALDEGPSTEHDIFWRKIGSVRSTSDNVHGDGANLDWALIELKNSTLHYHYMIARSLLWSKALSHNLAENESEKSVYFTGGVSGLGRGILSRTMSYILLAPGTNFTRVYSLALTEGTGKDYSRWIFLFSNPWPTL